MKVLLADSISKNFRSTRVLSSARLFASGETKRVEMALVFARNPSCFLADEIMRSADPILRNLLAHSMRLLAEQGCAVVVTGHEVSYLMPFLDSVTWVTSGTTYDLGPSKAACGNEKFASEYLGAGRSIASSF